MLVIPIELLVIFISEILMVFTLLVNIRLFASFFVALAVNIGITFSLAETFDKAFTVAIRVFSDEKTELVHSFLNECNRIITRVGILSIVILFVPVYRFASGSTAVIYNAVYNALKGIGEADGAWVEREPLHENLFSLIMV